MKTTVISISSFRHRKKNTLNEWSVCPKLHSQSLIMRKGLVGKLFGGVLKGNWKDRGVRQEKRKKWKLGGNPQLHMPADGGRGTPTVDTPQVIVLSLPHSGVKEACQSFWLEPCCPSPAHIHTQAKPLWKTPCCPSTPRYKCRMLKIKTTQSQRLRPTGRI